MKSYLLAFCETYCFNRCREQSRVVGNSPVQRYLIVYFATYCFNHCREEPKRIRTEAPPLISLTPKKYFVATNIILSRQAYFCRDETRLLCSHRVLLIMRNKVTRQFPHLLKREENRSGLEPRSFWSPAERLTARPNRLPHYQ